MTHEQRIAEIRADLEMAIEVLSYGLLSNIPMERTVLALKNFNTLAAECLRLREDKERLDAQLSAMTNTVTALCEAIDPECKHGPETEKLCAYAKQNREFCENGSLLQRLDSLEALSQLEQITDGPSPICPVCACRHLPHCQALDATKEAK